MENRNLNAGNSGEWDTFKKKHKQDKEGGINPAVERQKVGNPLLRVCDTRRS